MQCLLPQLTCTILWTASDLTNLGKYQQLLDKKLSIYSSIKAIHDIKSENKPNIKTLIFNISTSLI